MKIFTNKKIIHKIIAVIIILLLFNFILPNCSRAADGGLGGALLTPILELLVSIGDGIMWLIHHTLYGMNDTLVKITFATEWWQWALVIGAAILAAAAAACIIIATGGALAALVAKIGLDISISIGFGFVATVTVGSGIVAGVLVANEVLPDDLYLPIYEITPYEIFSNSVPTFDINFFKDYGNNKGTVSKKTGETTKTNSIDFDKAINATNKLLYALQKITEDGKKSGFYDNFKGVVTRIVSGDRATSDIPMLDYLKYMQHDANGGIDSEYTKEDADKNFLNLYKPNQAVHLIDQLYNNQTVKDANGKLLKLIDITKEEYDELFKVCGPENIGGANFYDSTIDFGPCSYLTNMTVDLTYEIQSSAGQLQGVVAGWYYTLRNLALIGLLSILVYVGIRIVISSTANEKAKYKSMIIDWIIAMCLLFFLHYIMAFSVKIVEKITEGLKGLNQNAYCAIIPDKDNKISNAMKNDESTLSKFKDSYVDKDGKKCDKDGFLAWSTNDVGYARIGLQLNGVDRKGATGESAGQSMMSKVSYTIIYLVLVAYTLIFSFAYIKRVLYMAFLTLIAPLVALTYPIDKLNDGKAQAFNTWFREYIFNLLIQPLHLILYTILIGTAFEFASKNMLYTIVALGFMVPAEKLLRRFFGFEKAQTPGAFAGPAGAALMMTGLNKMSHKPPKPHNDEEKESKSPNKIRSTDNSNPMEVLAGNSEGDNRNIGIRQQNQISKDENNSNSPMLGDGIAQSEAENSNDIRIVNNPMLGDDIAQSEAENNNNIKTINNSNNDSDNKYIEGDEPIKLAGENNEQKPTQSSARVITKPNGGNKFKKNDVTESKSKQVVNTKSNGGYIKNAFKGVGRGMKNMGYHYTRRLGNKVRKSHPIRAIRRATTAVAGGALAGTLGLVAGITSGDPSKAMQYAATGALVGGKFAKSAGDAIASSTKGGKKAYKQGYWGDQYLEQEQKQLIKEFSRDQKNVDYLMERGYAPKQIRTILNDVAPEYLSSGISDMDDILTGYKLEQGDEEYEKMDRKEAISTVKMANRLGDTRKSAKAEKEWEERLTKEYKNTSQIQEYYSSVKYQEQQNKIKADYEAEVKKLERKQMSNALRSQKMEEAKARRDELLKKHTDAPANNLANDTIARTRRVYDIKDNI